MISEVAVSVSNTDPTIYVWDIRSGSTLFSFKQNRSNGLCFIPRPGAPTQAGAIITSQVDRAVLHVYDWHRDQIQHKMLTSEKMVTVSASHQGQFTAAASASGKIYLWHNATGLLKCAFDAHYRAIQHLAFSHDDTMLISASDDATVKVWRLVELCSDVLGSAQPSPLFSWADHTLPVTAIHASSGLGATGRIYTASSDFTVKVWDLATGDLMTTFLFPKAVTAIAVHPAETTLFAACGNDIYMVGLYRQRQQQRYESVYSVGGHASVQAISNESTSSSPTDIFVGHSGIVYGLSLSFDGSLLVSASEDGSCIVWDVASHQLLRKFESHKGPVTGVECILRPMELITGTTQLRHAPIPLKPFKRTVASSIEDQQLSFEQQLATTNKDYAHAVQLAAAGAHHSSMQCEAHIVDSCLTDLCDLMAIDSQVDLQSQIAALQGDLGRLSNQYNKVKMLHGDMYNTLIDQFMSEHRARKSQN
ncbi:WD40-repeat-containing domain protein [Gongronella butleri]|nr:WD40-repeat-containing domain protein [Gongronella butleri]